MAEEMECSVYRASRSADAARALALHNGFHFLNVDHGGVTRRCHRQGSVGGAILDRGLRALAVEERVGEPRSEAVATTDAVIDLKVFPQGGLIELAAGPDDRAPVVEGRGLGIAQRRRRNLEIWKLIDRGRDHFLEVGRIDRRDVFIESLDLEAQAGSEILFVA